MGRFILRRLVATAFLILGVVLMTFALARLLPGDPARLIAGARADADAVAAIRARLGLDDPIFTQFLSYIGNVWQGDFGRSVVTRRPISEDILTFFPATLELVVCAALISVILGTAMGVLAAAYAGRRVDTGVRTVAVTGLSVPDFWLAMIFQTIFFATWGLVPFGGRLGTGIAAPEFVTGFMTLDSLLAGRFDLFGQALHHLIVPVAVLSIPTMAITVRVVRTAMLETLSQDYVRTARAKGIAPIRIYTHHALRNALLPIVTIFGLNTGLLLSGAVFIELIYDWPGLGRYTANAIAASDYNAIMAITLVVAVAYTLINLLVDLSYALLDPRVELA